MAMSHNVRIAIVVTLLIVVIFVVVHPLVDIEPTVLRSLQTSFLGLAVLVLAVTLATILVPLSSRYLATDNSGPRRKDHLSRLDLTCTFLC
jgi:hypothetical protein